MKTTLNPDLLKYDDKGLIPAVIQDAGTLRVLMLGYMNRDAVRKTIDEDRITFFSRSKQRLWTKGESSGNFLTPVQLHFDCDSDALLILARPEGPVCHTGNISCFYREDLAPASKAGFLFKLEHILQSRKNDRPGNSYTASLFNKGVDKIAQKVGEEAVETVIAAKNEDNEEFLYEASDLLFHLMILLTERGHSISDLIDELEKRHS